MRGDIIRAIHQTKVIEIAHDGNEEHVVLTLSERRALLREHADDLVRPVVDLDRFAERTLIGKELFLDVVAGDDDTARQVDVFRAYVAAVTERVRVGDEKI